MNGTSLYHYSEHEKKKCDFFFSHKINDCESLILATHPCVAGTADLISGSLIVGKVKISSCDHDTFTRFKSWVAGKRTQGNVDTYYGEQVSIEQPDDDAKSAYPHLLAACECGTYLPIEIEPGPMLSSAVGLLRELTRLNQYRDDMEPRFVELMDAMLKMAELSLNENIALEIR